MAVAGRRCRLAVARQRCRAAEPVRRRGVARLVAAVAAAAWPALRPRVCRRPNAQRAERRLRAARRHGTSWREPPPRGGADSADPGAGDVAAAASAEPDREALASELEALGLRRCAEEVRVGPDPNDADATYTLIIRDPVAGGCPWPHSFQSCLAHDAADCHHEAFQELTGQGNVAPRPFIAMACVLSSLMRACTLSGINMLPNN